MPSVTVRGPYASINTIFDPPQFSLDTTFNNWVIYVCVGSRDCIKGSEGRCGAKGLIGQLTCSIGNAGVEGSSNPCTKGHHSQ